MVSAFQSRTNGSGLEILDEAMKQLKVKEFELVPEPAAPVRSKRPEGYKKDN